MFATRTLGEICDEVHGIIRTGPFGSQLHESDYKNNGIPVIMPKNIVDGKISTNDIAKIGKEDIERLSQHKLFTGDIVYGRRGDIGRRALVTKRESGWLCGTGCLRISLGTTILDPQFLYYYLGQPAVIKMIANQAIGATLANLNTNIIRRISIKYPPFHNQRKIVTILANHDYLIENNIQRIKLLEHMAKLIYDEWFIKFKFPGHEHVTIVDSGTDLGKIPEDWELNGIMDIDYFSFISNNIDKFDGEKEYLATANIDEINIIKEGEKVSFTNKPSRAQKQPSINSVWFARMKDTYKVLGFTRSNRRIADSCILSSGFAGFESDELVFPFLYYTINSKKFHELKDMYATGATQVSLNNEALSQIKIIKPSLEIVNLFGDKILPFINEIFILQIINKNLSKTRDLLLPKLMSGEIDISELDIKVSGVNI